MSEPLPAFLDRLRAPWLGTGSPPLLGLNAAASPKVAGSPLPRAASRPCGSGDAGVPRAGTPAGRGHELDKTLVPFDMDGATLYDFVTRVEAGCWHLQNGGDEKKRVSGAAVWGVGSQFLARAISLTWRCGMVTMAWRLEGSPSAPAAVSGSSGWARRGCTWGAPARVMVVVLSLFIYGSVRT
jgi:hypothetical protein